VEIVQLSEENWQELITLNLKGMFLTCKHVLPVMRKQKRGVIINISSTASICIRPTLAYKTSKAGVNAMTQNLAIENAPIAIERRVRERGVDREIIRRERDAQVPLASKMGTAWDVAAAAAFLASDEARYITGILLLVDGGLSARIG
jgi:NAD(P)-dependent dehydrogenase (short-subunit alcohol dehydrogenase family)